MQCFGNFTLASDCIGIPNIKSKSILFCGHVRLRRRRVLPGIDIKKPEAVCKHWDDESWFEPKTKDGEPRKFPSLTVEELPGVIGKEEAEKRGYKFKEEEPKAEDKKEEPEVKSKIVYSKGTTDKK